MPLLLGSTSLDTTPIAGKLEYDGKVHYLSNVASQRGVVPSVIFTSNVADFTLANSANAQSPFEAARDVLTVEAATTYKFELLLQITAMGATTRTTALEFDSGTCTLTGISYFADIFTGAANTITTTFGAIHAVAATAQVINATVATAAATIRATGIIRVNAAGTLIPQIKFSADPTGTILCKKDSYFIMYSLGTNTVGSSGNWA